MINRLQALQTNKAQYPNSRVLMQSLKTDFTLRKEIEALSKEFLQRTVRGCSNCYYDAYFELINLTPQKIMSTTSSQFSLKRGALLRDVINQDVSKYMSFENATDELALYHLRTNPSCVKYFCRLPENWKELVEAYQIESTEEEKQEISITILSSEETQLIKEIVRLLKIGTTKTAIQQTYKSTTLNGKRLTIARLKELIKQAEEKF